MPREPPLSRLRFACQGLDVQQSARLGHCANPLAHGVNLVIVQRSVPNAYQVSRDLDLYAFGCPRRNSKYCAANDEAAMNPLADATSLLRYSA